MNSDLSPRHRAQSGNAMIYILIALALFGALTMILSRQNERSSNESVTEDLLNFEATRLKSYAASAQDSVNKMIMSGSNVDELDFTMPNSPSYELGITIQKVFHPEGGGLLPGTVETRIFTGTDNAPPPGWYMGRFNHVQWTPTTATDVVLTAHQISQPLCAQINRDITGSDVIPAIAGTGILRDYFIDDVLHTGTNANLTTIVCAACDQKPVLCVSNAAQNMWSVYFVIEGR